jgi:hypothetical protein
MSGGLFGTPLALNLKCLLFSGMLIVIYWLPPWRIMKTPYDIMWGRIISIGLAFSGYILMAWYDYIYDANDFLRPTALGWLSAPFKPPYYARQFEGLPEKWKKTVRIIDIFALVLAILFVLSPFVFL